MLSHPDSLTPAGCAIESISLLPLAILLGFAAFVLLWAAVKGLYLATLRQLLYRAGYLLPSAHDLEVKGWHAERAGQTELAVEWYITALKMNPGNVELRRRLVRMTDRELPPDPSAGEWQREQSDLRQQLRDAVGMYLARVPPDVWDITQHGDGDEMRAAVRGKEVSRVRVDLSDSELWRTPNGMNFSFDEAAQYLAGEINRAIRA